MHMAYAWCAACDAARCATTACCASASRPAPEAGATASEAAPRTESRGTPRTLSYEGMGTAVRKGAGMGVSFLATAASKLAASPCSPASPSSRHLDSCRALTSNGICAASFALGTPMTHAHGGSSTYVRSSATHSSRPRASSFSSCGRKSTCAARAASSASSPLPAAPPPAASARGA